MQYNVKLQHLPGNKITQADALSRRPDHVTKNHDNKDLMMLSKNLFLRIINLTDYHQIIEALKEDQSLGQPIIQVMKEKSSMLKQYFINWMTRDDLIFYQGHCYILPNNDL